MSSPDDRSNPFSYFTDDELRALGEAIDSARGEGAWAWDDEHPLAEMLATEATRRNINLTTAYHHDALTELLELQADELRLKQQQREAGAAKADEQIERFLKEGR